MIFWIGLGIGLVVGFVAGAAVVSISSLLKREIGPAHPDDIFLGGGGFMSWWR